MARNIKFAPGEFYHLYNRGTEKRQIFTSTADYERFLALLYVCNSTKPVHLGNFRKVKSYRGRNLIHSIGEIERGSPLVDIGAYCLMPNHFHLLLQEVEEGGISRFMQKLITGYSMYFNTRYQRSGALFQGKFKAQRAGGDRYLKYLMSYIHLNPVKLFDPAWKERGVSNKKRTKIYLENYRYSSYSDYCGKERVEQIILNKKVLPEYFNSPKNFSDGVMEWITTAQEIPRFDLGRSGETEVEPR